MAFHTRVFADRTGIIFAPLITKTAIVSASLCSRRRSCRKEKFMSTSTHKSSSGEVQQAIMARRIVGDQISALGESTQAFPQAKLAELVLRVSGEILNETMWPRLCVAITVIRRRDVPGGTVGGRIPCANTPCTYHPYCKGDRTRKSTHRGHRGRVADPKGQQRVSYTKRLRHRAHGWRMRPTGQAQ